MRTSRLGVAILVPGLWCFHQTPGFEYDAEEIRDVVPRLYVTALTGVDRPDRHPVEAEITAETKNDHVDLELESGLVAFERSLHEPAADQPIAGLIIEDLVPHRPGQAGAPDGIRDASRKWHFAKIAVANDEIAIVRKALFQEFRNLGGIVLPVGINRDDGFAIGLLQRPAKALFERCAFALIRSLSYDDGACCFRDRGSFVSGTIIDRDHRQESPCGVNDGSHEMGGVVSGNQNVNTHGVVAKQESDTGAGVAKPPFL